jgi:hypothetical protein
MANNIQIVGSILSTQEISRYNVEDTNLLSSNLIQENFGQSNDYIEYFIYDAGGNLLNTNYNYKNFKLPATYGLNPAPYENAVGVVSNYSQSVSTFPIIEIDPILDLRNLGYSSGEFKVQYNFFNNQISNPNAELFLKEISADRTEIRVGSTILTNEQIESGSLALINEYSSSAYFVEYLINFGDNNQAVAVNVALNKVESGYEILFKLYQPLPDNIQEKISLWVVKEKVNPYFFDINLDKLITPEPLPILRGPNFGIKIDNQNNVATSYQTYTSLVNDIQSISTSSYQQLLSLITSQNIDINTDYTNFENFVFFSSAEQRVLKFYNKVKQIEDYKTNISIYIPLTASRADLINDYNFATSSINNIISKFDGFEYYLYFGSGSLTSSNDYGITPYPKNSSTLPYSLYPTGSSQVQTWLGFSTSSAENYDNNNQNYIVNTLPSFIKDDNDNASYVTFVDMVGHYFDNIWVFLQAITDVNLANNNLEQGVSKDLVYNVLQSLGTKLYNQYGDSDNVNFLIGESGSANFDNNFTSTGSYLNTIPRKDLLAESYKRIYHNLPLLLKTKGTTYGLQTLISTFGITGSILQVKEYGGDTKSGLLDEFNNDKIRIVSNTITGSVLSPNISLQTPNTSSTLFRTNDLHYVDISFSPQEKIDIFVSASIAANATTWSLDDFIGDPRAQYSSSYSTLNIERHKYYSPLSASVVPYTGSAGGGTIAATDYNSFTRLIQFFDNSLFKMLKDFVPARTNLSTGISISSPVLERNKWSYANPSSTSEIETNEGTIDGVGISTEYTNLYSKLSGSKAAYYNGNISGSSINVYSYYENSNPNPYTLGTIASWNAQHAVSESININKFLHSDFNVLFNNVSESLISKNRQDIQYVFGTTQSIITPAELQDSYESLRTHQLSRYEGVKLTSAKYNDYTNGDISFGKSAVIDKNVVKLGLFSEIIPNRFLPKRNNAVLKYLVDIDGNLTELNLRNNHWEEVQNTFIAGDTGSISQFNNQLYSNQKTTDGEKSIFNSGYSYSPILYFSTCSNNPDISFQNQGNSSAYLATAQNLSSSYLITGSGTIGYPLNEGYVLNLFNFPIDVNQGSNYWTNTTVTSPATYSVQETGQYAVYARVKVTTEMPANNNATWSLEMYKNGTKVQEVSESLFFGDLSQECREYNIINEGNDDITVQWEECNTGIFRARPVRPGDSIDICARNYEVFGNYWTDTIGPTCGTYIPPGGSTTQVSFLTINNGYSGNSNYSNFNINDKISFKLRLVGATAGSITATLATGDDGFVSIGSLALSTGYAVATCPYISTAASSSISLTPNLSSFYGSNYYFAPNPTSGSISPLYDNYGDVDYPFVPKPYDLLILYLSDGSILEYTILSIDVTGGKLFLNLDAPLSNLAISNLTGNNYRRFLLLSRIKDETNVILNFIKRDGKTSYGFLIADNISSNVLDNIDTITREVKQKLLNDQSVINDINGGTFG